MILQAISSGLALGITILGARLLEARITGEAGASYRGQRLRGLAIAVPAACWFLTGWIGGSWIGAFCVGAALCAGLLASRLDLRLGLVPDAASLVIALTGLVFASLDISPIGLGESVAGLLLASAILLLAGQLVKWRSGQAGLGEGDPGLGAACASWTGVFGVGPALLVAVALTGTYAMVQRATGKTRLPFAPGLIAGFGLTALAQVLI